MESSDVKHAQEQEAVRVAEAQTGTSAVPRTMAHEDSTSTIDPRFDRDDLRQGKAPPALRKHNRRLHIRRHRTAKGTPLTAAEKDKARAGQGKTPQEGENEAEMTEEEVDLSGDEEEHEDGDGKGKKGLLSKVLGKS